MSKLLKFGFALGLALVYAMFMYFQYTDGYNIERLLILLSSTSLNVIALFILVAFLLYRVYLELSREHLVKKSYYRVLWSILLPLIIVIYITTDFPISTNLYIQYQIIFRFSCILALMFIVDEIFYKSENVKIKMVVTGLVIILSSLIFMIDISVVDTVISLFYTFSIILLLYFFVTSKKGNKLQLQYFYENSVYILISLSMLNDILVLSTSFVKVELLFIGISFSILMGFSLKIFNMASYYSLLEVSKNDYKKKYLEILKEKDGNVLSVEKFKSDLSIKYNTKKNYFENLELVLEVADLSVLIINSDFKIEMAHGLILELSELSDIVGLEVSKVIFETSSEDGLYFKSVVEKIFEATDEIRENLYISLLDKKLCMSNFVFELNYNVVHKRNNEKVLILKAIKTSDFSRENTILTQEKEISDMIISIVRNSELFFCDLSSYLEFCKNMPEFVDIDISPKENIFRVLRRVHTYKGVFDQYNMNTFTQGLNNIENELLNMLHNLKALSNAQFTRILIGYELERMLAIDISIINQRLGDSFLNNRNRAFVDLTAFNRVFKKLKKRLDESGDKELVRELEILKEVDIFDVLLAYEKYIERIATEQGKMINYIVSGDHITVSRSGHVNLFEGLIHIFKNSIAHGVEYPDERRSLGKSETATIKCEVRLLNNQIQLSISDDGRGIDAKEIRNRLFILGKYSIEQLEKLPDSEVFNMIVEDGITSQVIPNSLAGRGVGMGSLKEIIGEINGTIDVKSVINEGVTYDLVIPLRETIDSEKLNYETLLNDLCIQAERTLTRDVKKNKLSSTWNIEASKIFYGDLLDCTVKIKVKGNYDIDVLATADERFLEQLINSYGLQMKYKGSNIKAFNEVLNTFIYSIVEKSLIKLKSIRETVSIMPPVIVSKCLIESDFNGYNANSASIKINDGKFVIMVIEGKE